LNQRLTQLTQKPRLRQLLRYTITSGGTTLLSEATLLLLYGYHLLGASGASIVANLAGVLPSYLVSRYWIWPEAERKRPLRQMLTYWIISLFSLITSTAVTSLAAAHAPLSHSIRLVVVGLAYFGTYVVLWLLKYLAYNKLVFKSTHLC
jgi:putative flippase GtrA